MRSLTLTIVGGVAGLACASCQPPVRPMVKLCSDVHRHITIYDDYSYAHDGQRHEPQPCGNTPRCFMVPFPIFDVEEHYQEGVIKRFGTFDVRFDGPSDILNGNQIVDHQELGYSTRTATTAEPRFPQGGLQYGVSYDRRRGIFLIFSDEFGILTPCEGRLMSP